MLILFQLWEKQTIPKKRYLVSTFKQFHKKMYFVSKIQHSMLQDLGMVIFAPEPWILAKLIVAPPPSFPLSLTFLIRPGDGNFCPWILNSGEINRCTPLSPSHRAAPLPPNYPLIKLGAASGTPSNSAELSEPARGGCPYTPWTPSDSIRSQTRLNIGQRS